MAMVRNEINKSMLVEFGEQAIIYTSLQSILGYVSENGFIYDSCRNLLGSVSQQGVVRTPHLRMVGHVNIKLYSFPFRAGAAAFFLLLKAQEV
jgi:hypothetical protein